MKIEIRRATVDDIDPIIEIKDGLMLKPGEVPHSGGGFFMPADRTRMEQHLEEDILHVAEDPDRKFVLGYTLVLNHKTVMEEIWPRRPKGILPEDLPEKYRMGWYDQWGVRTGAAYRLLAPLIALRALEAGFAAHDIMGSVLMSKPAFNANSIKMMTLVGYQLVGETETSLPGVEKATFNVYVVDQPTFQAHIAEPRVQRIINRIRGWESAATSP